MAAADVVVTDEDVTVVMDVPGVKARDLEIELVDDVLSVRGERTFAYQTAQDDQRVLQRLERGFGKFERVLRAPRGLDAGVIQAEMGDGVLTLHIRKPAEHRPHRVEITTGSAQPMLEESRAASEERETKSAAA